MTKHFVFWVLIGAAALTGASGRAAGEASFVGSGRCAQCHERVYRDWSGSHHDLAMQEATQTTVLGDFDDVTFTAHGVTSRFFEKHGDYYVNTEGSDGAARDYRIEYTFGVYPLQQYLIAFPGGRYQALSIAWDARPKEQGGQRWFHLYPAERIAPDDVLHWTGINQNWNYMCADCHTTNLRRNFDRLNDRYDTTWSEIDVSCEACHGPGAQHVTWAASERATGAAQQSSKGLETTFAERRDVRWMLAEGLRTAARSAPPAGFRAEVETCGRCHARRSPLRDEVDYGKPLLDSYRLALLTDELYYPDGQIKDEVYVYGSFRQSKMYRAGVTCSDCHDPHSLRLRADGNALCTRCHRREAFDTPAHHFHADGTAGSRCVECHAPRKTYMVVDPRRDHGFRVPRPDLSVTLGVPNACTGCHGDRAAQWAADRVTQWYGPHRAQSPHFGEAIAGGRDGDPGAKEQLIRIARDDVAPAIVRATALETLGQNVDREVFPVILEGLRSRDPLIRLAAVGSLEFLGPRERFRAAFPLVEDPVRAVRLEAARQLAPVPLERLAPESREALAAAFAEFERAHEAIADRPESRTSLANFYRDRALPQQAEATYRETMARYPRFAPAYVNLADLYRSLDQDEKGEAVLRDALQSASETADVQYAYGLLLVRERRTAEATKHLGEAARLRPENPRYSYVHALALHKTGDADGAMRTLRAAHDRHPNDRDILFALATISRDRGDLDAAVQYAETLVGLSPGDAGAVQLLEALLAQRR